MTSQYDFSNAEWSDIALLPVLVGFAVAKAEDSGRFGSLREIRTLTSSVTGEAPDGPAKALIEAASLIDVKDEIEDLDEHSPELLGDVAVKACRSVGSLLGGRASAAETSGYQTWVYRIGEEVANAAKEHGVRISDPEAELLDRLARALKQPTEG